MALTNQESTVEIYYNGATGGNYLLWLMLLATDYRCFFNNFKGISDEDLKKIYNRVWNKDSRQHWATQEIEVDIEKTVSSNTIKKKVLLLSNQHWLTPIGVNTKIVLYTDTFTQSLLSIEKQASFGAFFNSGIANGKQLIEAANHLSQLIPSFEFKNSTIASYYNSVIDINQADAVFELKDLVKTNGASLLNFLNVTDVKNAGKDFSAHYINLHSDVSRSFFV
jgi:hypothetical protein